MSSLINDPSVFNFGTRIFLAIIICGLIVAGLLGNALVCLSIYRNKELRTLTNWFILNMCSADLGVILFCMPFPLGTYIAGYWPFNDPTCQFNGFLNSHLLLASILTLMMISLHQYLTVVKRWSYSKLRKAAIIMLVSLWVHATLLSIIPLTRMAAYDHKQGRAQCSVKIPEKKTEKLTAIIYIITGFVLPLAVMSFSYFKIMKVVRTHSKRMTTTLKRSSTMKRRVMQRQLVSTLIIVLAVFLVCWTPFLIMSLLGGFVPSLYNGYLGDVAFLLGYANSCCNPVVLGVRNRLFKSEYEAIIKDFGCWGYPCAKLFRNRSDSSVNPRSVVSESEMSGSGVKNSSEVDEDVNANRKASKSDKVL